MAGRRGLILLMIMVMMMIMTGAWRYSQNTIFRKTSKVIITRSKWLVTFVIDLDPYKLQLEKSESEIKGLSTARVKVA